MSWGNRLFGGGFTIMCRFWAFVKKIVTIILGLFIETVDIGRFISVNRLNRLVLKVKTPYKGVMNK